jgi:hypothetical protein
MKKRNLLFAILIFCGVTIYAQEQEPEINIGGNLGITTNDTQVVVGLDGELLYAVDQNFKVGVATGLIFATKNNGVLLPLAFSGRFKADTKLGVGLDLGYAIPINKSTGSLYVRPMLEYKLSNKSNLKFSYSGLNSVGYLNIGILFRMNHNRRSLTISY